MKWNNVRQVLALIADDTIRLVQKRYKEPRPVQGVRATWKKGKPSGWRYVSLKPQPKDNTGRLSSSLNYQIEERDGSVVLEVRGADYLEYVEKGRYPYMQNIGGGKGIPPAKLDKWIGQRDLKPRDAKGRFIAKSDKNMRAMSFMINRKIKWFGIAPSNIIRDTRAEVEDQWQEDLIEAFEMDIADELEL